MAFQGWRHDINTRQKHVPGLKWTNSAIFYNNYVSHKLLTRASDPLNMLRVFSQNIISAK